MDTSIIIHGKNASTGAKTQQSFTDINPKASNDEIKNFAQAINSLTNDLYVEAERINKINVDTEESLQFRNITITGATSGATATITANTTPNDNINPAVFFYYSSGSVSILNTTHITRDVPTVAKLTINVPNSSGTIFIGLTEQTNNFYADFIRSTVS